MNNIQSFLEHTSENIEFLIKTNEDHTYITAYQGAKIFGNVVINWITASGYDYEFNNELSEDDYDRMFPDDKFAKIEQIKVDKKYRSSGYAKKLMERAIEIIKEEGFDRVYLNANPMGFDGLDVNDLVGFYKTFGFEIIPELDMWPQNKEMILYI